MKHASIFRIQKVLLLAAMAMGLFQLDIPANAAQVSNTLISRASGQTGVVGNGESIAPDMTPDGKYVVFESDATNLMTGLTGKRQIFLRNLQTSQLELISMTPAGKPGGDVSYQAHISADGRYVTFTSSAKDLIPNDTSTSDNIYLRDRQLNTTVRISNAFGGGNGNDASYQSRITGDGRFILFESRASNLVPGDTNGMSDGFLLDRNTGITERVTLSSTGAQLSGNPGGRLEAPAISDDGNLIVFQTDLNVANVVPGDAGTTQDVFIRNRGANTTTRLSVNPVTGEGGNAQSIFPFISRDGSTIVFTSYATNLVSGSALGTANVYMYKPAAKTLTRITNGNGQSGQCTVSADGRFVAFASTATNLEPQATNGVSQQYLYDSQLGTLEVLSIASDGNAGNGPSGSTPVAGQTTVFCCYSYVSTDGRFIAYDSYASNLVVDDQNNFGDVFVHDRQPAVIANAGGDQTVMEGQTVVLNGTKSIGTGFQWTQTGGPQIADGTGATTPIFTFTAPTVTATTVLTFRLVVTSDGNVSTFDTVKVTDQVSGGGNPNGLPTPPGGVVDGNGNGVPLPVDIIQQIGGDPNDPNNSKTPVTTTLPLNVTLLQIRFNFGRSNSDNARVLGTLNLPAGFAAPNTPVVVYIGGESCSGQYDAKGRLKLGVTSNGNGHCTFTMPLKKPKKGQQFPGGPNKFSIVMQKAAFVAGLGITDNADQKNVPIDVPVLVMLNRMPYFVVVHASMTSKHLKTGMIKK